MQKDRKKCGVFCVQVLTVSVHAHQFDMLWNDLMISRRHRDYDIALSTLAVLMGERGGGGGAGRRSVAQVKGSATGDGTEGSGGGASFCRHGKASNL